MVRCCSSKPPTLSRTLSLKQSGYPSIAPLVLKPMVPHTVSTIVLTVRVETSWMYISASASINACSLALIPREETGLKAPRAVAGNPALELAHSRRELPPVIPVAHLTTVRRSFKWSCAEELGELPVQGFLGSTSRASRGSDPR